MIGPSHSIWIPSFGSKQLGNGDHLLCRITDFKFLTISVQALRSLALANISRWIYGHHIFWASGSMAKLVCIKFFVLDLVVEYEIGVLFRLQNVLQIVRSLLIFVSIFLGVE